MGQLPKTSSLMDLNQVVSLTGRLSWDLSAPSTISFGDTALLPIKGDAPPFTWAIVGAAVGTGEYSLKYTQTKRLLNVLSSDLSAVNLPTIEVVDARGNRITQSLIEIPLPPTADLTGDTSILQSLSGDFDASGSTPGAGASIKKYEWDWSYNGIYFVPSGDTGSTQSHTFNWSGNYTVAVRVRDNYNRTDIATLEVAVIPVQTLWEDTFTGEESITVHVAETGHRYDGPGTISGGVLTSGSNALIKNTSNTAIETFGNRLDGVLTLMLGTVNARPIYKDIRMRYLNENNFLYLSIADSGTSTTIRLWKKIAGVTSALSSSVSASIVTGDIIVLELIGDSFIASVKTGSTTKATVTNIVAPSWSGGYGISLAPAFTDGITITYGKYEG